MKKVIILISIILTEAILLVGVLFCISKTRSHSKALPFEITQDKRQSVTDENIQTAANDNYWKFVNKRFILAVDDEGVTQWVKVDNDYGRNDYDFESENAITREDSIWYYNEAGERNSSIGIDVSKYQGTIDWAQVKASGVTFAFIRVGLRGYGNGKLVLDDNFEQNIQGALANDIKVGVYFFTQATTYEEGAEEANYVLEQIAGYNVTLPVVVDSEDVMDDTARTANLTPQERTQALLGFMDTVRNAGYSPMLYTGLYWLALDLDITMMHGYDIWYAQYADVPKLPYQYKIWQYTESGTIPGISQPVDINIGFDHYGE